MSLRTFWGLLLLGGGFALLSVQLHVVPVDSRWITAAFAAAAGLSFVWLFAADRTRWWALVPAPALFAAAALRAAAVVAPDVAETWGGPVFLGAVALGFWAVYWVRREWWAFLLSTATTTLAVVSHPSVGGHVFVFGLAASFLLAGSIRHRRGAARWALAPGVLLTAVGVSLFAGQEQLVSLAWPAVLILAGGYLLFRQPSAESTWWRRGSPRA